MSNIAPGRIGSLLDVLRTNCGLIADWPVQAILFGVSHGLSFARDPLANPFEGSVVPSTNGVLTTTAPSRTRPGTASRLRSSPPTGAGNRGARRQGMGDTCEIKLTRDEARQLTATHRNLPRRDNRESGFIGERVTVRWGLAYGRRYVRSLDRAAAKGDTRMR